MPLGNGVRRLFSFFEENVSYDTLLNWAFRQTNFFSDFESALEECEDCFVKDNTIVTESEDEDESAD